MLGVFIFFSAKPVRFTKALQPNKNNSYYNTVIHQKSLKLLSDMPKDNSKKQLLKLTILKYCIDKPLDLIPV